MEIKRSHRIGIEKKHCDERSRNDSPKYCMWLGMKEWHKSCKTHGSIVFSFYDLDSHAFLSLWMISGYATRSSWRPFRWIDCDGIACLRLPLAPPENSVRRASIPYPRRWKRIILWMTLLTPTQTCHSRCQYCFFFCVCVGLTRVCFLFGIPC